MMRGPSRGVRAAPCDACRCVNRKKFLGIRFRIERGRGLRSLGAVGLREFWGRWVLLARVVCEG